MTVSKGVLTMDRVINNDYNNHLVSKSQINNEYGFEPLFMPDCAFDFQRALIEWSVKKGRAACYADCGLGKSIIELSFAQNVVQKTNGNVLLLTPLAVGQQMEREAEKFGIEAKRSRDGKTTGKITITNYEQLEKFDPSDFTGVVCDESSILKNYDGKTKEAITIFARKMKYRLLATATAAPNDFIELGTSSEALGYLGYMDMLGKYFVNDQNNCATNTRGRFNEATKWRMRGWAHEHFWRWVASWARAVRFPSDIGFSDEGYNLPELIENHIELRDLENKPADMLFSIPANGLKENRDEQVATITDRCERAAQIANESKDFCVVWCNRNEEGDLLTRLIKDAVQVSGKDSDEKKEEKLNAFSRGENRVMVIKPKIGAWGLNWQHCNHTIFFPSYSYEQYYQSIRRFWRFGQKRPVTCDVIYTEGSAPMVANLRRKKEQAKEMFDKLVEYMNDGMNVSMDRTYTEKPELPAWLR
jgi:hypothetical protein